MKKILPPGMSFRQALRTGHAGRMVDDRYRAWVKTLPCCACGQPADDPHHPHGAGIGRGMGTKVPDHLCIPLCRPCHDELHRDVDAWEFVHRSQLEHSLYTLLQAIAEGVLTMKGAR